jgi:hypothetical protein
MAIDRIPGVGPQNSDIASAIATTPAVSAQITANVPTAAAIASAVAAPSSATIQNLIQTYAAPASVTMAAITSSITTNAASAGVTNASIAATVAANAGSQFSGTWTNLAFVNFGATPSTAGLNVSGLTGYKYLRLITTAYVGVTNTWRLRFNGASANYYGMSLRGMRGSSALRESRFSSSSGIFMGDAWIENQPPTIDLMIENSNSSARKIVKATDFSYINGSSQTFTGSGFGVWDDNSQISSLQLDAFGSNVTGGFAVLWGGN